MSIRRSGGRGAMEAARRWAGWWIEEQGFAAGVGWPLGFAVLFGLADLRAVPLGLAAGIGAGLLWTRGERFIPYALLAVLVVCFGLIGATSGLGESAGVGFVAAALLAAFLLAGVYGAIVVLRLFGGRAEPTPHYGAHWATEEETEDLVVGPREGGGNLPEDAILLGHSYERVIGVRPGFEGRRELGHALVSGPSRSGKSLHLVTQLFSWGGSAVALDVKGELYELTASVRREILHNDVLVLDPSGRGERYDPFAELSHSPEALKSAVNLVMEPDKGREPIFAQRAASALYAAVLGARLEGAPTLPYVRELTAEGPGRFVEHLSSLGDSRVRRALVDFLNAPPEEVGPREFRDDRFLQSSWGTMTTRLGPLMSEGVLKMMGGSDFRAADLVERPTTLYLMFNESELEYTEKAFQLVMLSLVSGLIRRGDLNPGEEGVPMLLALDEAGRTPIPRLDDLVSTIAGRGMSALVYVQDLGQLEDAYGRYGARTIRANCHTEVYYRPTDLDTASYISKRSGRTSVEDVRVSSGSGHESTSVGMRERELVTPDEVTQGDARMVYVFAGSKPPILAHRLEWFRIIRGAQEYLRENPPPEPPELPLPEVTLGDGADGPGGSGGAPRAGEREKPGGEPAADAPRKKRRRVRRRAEGYVEPDL